MVRVLRAVRNVPSEWLLVESPHTWLLSPQRAKVFSTLSKKEGKASVHIKQTTLY